MSIPKRALEILYVLVLHVLITCMRLQKKTDPYFVFFSHIEEDIRMLRLIHKDVVAGATIKGKGQQLKGKNKGRKKPFRHALAATSTFFKANGSKQFKEDFFKGFSDWASFQNMNLATCPRPELQTFWSVVSIYPNSAPLFGRQAQTGSDIVCD